MFKITDVSIVDLGVDHPSYFQGFGAGDEHEHAVYGIGTTATEAYDDALEAMCQSDHIDIESMPKASELMSVAGIDPDSAIPEFVDSPESDHSSELYYHIGIRYNLTQ